MRSSSTTSRPVDLAATLRQTLAAHPMVSPGDRVLVGVSGGPDSMALLHLLSRLASELKIGLGAAHLDHCLRAEAGIRDAELVRRTAEQLQCPCHLGRAQVARVQRKLRLSPEEAARRVRYAFFNKIMIDEGYNKLALGHHADDNAEQMLMALLRGAGPRGLSGIAPVREGRIVRPLIAARREAIETFVRQEGLVCTCDATNSDLRFVRNRIRHRLLPLLAAEYNPRIVDQLNQTADLVRSEEDWMAAMAAARYRRCRMPRDRGPLTLSTAALAGVPVALARRLVRQALTELAGSLRRITFGHIQAVLHLTVGRRGEKECHLPGGIRVRRVGEHLTFWIEAGAPRKMHGQRVTPPATLGAIIAGPFPERVEIRTLGVGLHLFPCRPDRVPAWERVDRKRAYFDLDRLSLPLKVRQVQPGDRFTPLGAAGSQKVKKFFIDHHVPRHARARCPVLADGRRIIWLVGHRMGDEAKVTPVTSHVLGVEYFLLDTR